MYKSQIVFFISLLLISFGNVIINNIERVLKVILINFYTSTFKIIQISWIRATTALNFNNIFYV